jgi:hypothetical protein
MTNRAKAAGMARNRNIIGRVGKDEICRLAFQDGGKAALIQRIAAQHAMASELPEIADLADRPLLDHGNLI